MGFNKENYKRIKEEYEGKYLRAIDSAKLRREEVHSRVSGVAEIDRDLAMAGLRIFEASVKNDKKALEEINKENVELQAKRAKLLVSAGYPSNYTEIKYECELCGDTGAIDNKMCICMKKKLVEEGFKSSGMYDLIQKQSFDNFDMSYYSGNKENFDRMTKIVAALKRFANDFTAEKAANIAMLGNTGLGKTHLSSAIAGVVIEKGNDVYYTSAMNMFGDFEYQRFGNSASPDAEGDIDKYFSCDLLIIDDLGAEINNQFTTSCLYNIINTRLNKNKSTIINTNLTQEELRKRYWDRIASRIFGEYLILPFCGDDVRAQKLNRK